MLDEAPASVATAEPSKNQNLLDIETTAKTQAATNTAVDRAKGSDKLAKERKAEAAKEPVAWSTDRSKFVHGETTGIDATKEHHKKLHPREKETVEFSEGLQTQFKSFLKTHLQDLLKITNPQLLDKEFFGNEIKIIEDLTTENQPDLGKINNFLQTEEGWSFTEKLIEQQTGLQLVACGLEVSINPQGKRVTRIDSHTVALHADQGVLNHLIKERLGHFLNERAFDVAGRPHGDWRDRMSKGGFTAANVGASVLASGIGTALGSIIGQPGYGALVGLVAPEAVEGVMHLFRNGVTIDTNQSVEAFKVIKQIKGAAEYMKAVMDIDINNLQDVGGKIVEAPGHTFIGTGMDKIENKIYQGLFSRQEFYQALGVPSEAIDALPEQFLLRANPKSAEQTSVRLDKRIQELLNYNDPSVKGATESSRIKKFFWARKKAMMEQLESYEIKNNEIVIQGDAVTKIKEKMTRRGENGEEVKIETEKHNKRKKELENEKTKLDKPYKAVTEYQTQKKALEDSLEAYNKEFASDVIAGRSIDQALERLNNFLLDVTDNSSIAFEANALEIQKAQETQKAISKATPGKTKYTPEARGKLQQQAIDTTENLFKNREALLDIKRQKVIKQIARLEELKLTKETAEKTLIEKSQELLGLSRENLTTVFNNFDALTNAATGIGITEPQLYALSVDEIMVEINRINLADPTKGWPAGIENNNPLKRRMVIDGKAEAKARFNEQIDPDKPQRDADFGNLTGWGITEDQLRTIPRSQLLAMIHLKGAAGGGQGWLIADDAARGVELDRSIYEAKNRMLLRYSELISQQNIDLQTQIEAEAEKIKAINFENDIDILTTIKDVMERQGKVFEVAYQLTSNRGKYVDVDKIGTADKTYSQNEKDLGASKGYWEMMNAIFGYKEKVDRGTYVSKIIKTLPPADLAKHIHDALRKAGLKGVPAATSADYSDLDKALKKLNKGIETESVNNFETRRLVSDIINNLRAQADAI